ncbi:hypothetical protein BCV71DRAFT_159229, partial [Rhizopus microsporus]
ILYEDGHGNVVDENGGPEPIEYIIETITTHTDYLKHTVSDGSSPTCSMLVEKSKDKDVRMNEASTKRDYVHCTV